MKIGSGLASEIGGVAKALRVGAEAAIKAPNSWIMAKIANPATVTIKKIDGRLALFLKPGAKVFIDPRDPESACHREDNLYFNQFLRASGRLDIRSVLAKYLEINLNSLLVERNGFETCEVRPIKELLDFFGVNLPPLGLTLSYHLERRAEFLGLEFNSKSIDKLANLITKLKNLIGRELYILSRSQMIAPCRDSVKSDVYKLSDFTKSRIREQAIEFPGDSLASDEMKNAIKLSLIDVASQPGITKVDGDYLSSLGLDVPCVRICQGDIMLLNHHRIYGALDSGLPIEVEIINYSTFS